MLDTLERDFKEWKENAAAHMDELRILAMQYEKWTKIYLEASSALKRLEELRKV